jgi:predicted transcriptional regulator
MPLTTIKVPVELRDRVSEDARARGVSMSALLAELVDEYERAQRFAAVRRAYADLPAADDYETDDYETDDYAAETREWDSALAADGLPSE